MRTLKFLLQKEFLQIFRSGTLVRIIFLAPIIQLLILPLAANYTIKNINLAIVDHDHSSYSQKLISKIFSSGYFKLAGSDETYDQAYKLIENDKADIILEIPENFEQNLVNENSQKVFVAVNAINGVKALTGSGYLDKIVMDFNRDIRAELIQPASFSPAPVIEAASSYWFNPYLVYFLFMVPGILVLLLTMVGGNLSALNIVHEKEVGTIEQINVTPIKKYIFILGKLIPFWLMGLLIFTVGLLIARFIYGIIPLGNIGLLYLFATVYLFALLGFGLLISTYSQTQQQAQSVIFFFFMIFNLMGGLFTPIDSMPPWAQIMTYFIPVKYFIEVMRMNVIKGSGFNDIAFDLGAILLMGIVLNVWAVINYKKTT